jgi:hypothetical protein
MIGFFKSTNGSSLCIACSSGLSTLQIGTTSGLMCECGAGTETIDGGICQICLPGTYSVGGVGVSCTPCPPGTYGNTSQLETAQCSGLCESGFFCPLGSISSQQIRCPFDYSISLIGSDDQFDCTCIPGATGDDGGYCARCPIGYYGAGGNSSCIKCTSFTSTGGPGASHISDCKCQPGFQRINGICSACARDQYKAAAADTLCDTCPPLTSIPLRAATSLEMCICKPGYDGENGGPCTPTPNPTVYVNVAQSQTSPSSAQFINFVANFSRAIAALPSSSVIINGTAGATLAFVTGWGREWSISISGMTQAGTVIVSIAHGLADTDLSADLSLPSRSSNNVVYYDNERAACNLVQAHGQADPTFIVPVFFTATFTKPITLLQAGASSNVLITSSPVVDWPEGSLLMIGDTFGVVSVSGVAPIGTSTTVSVKIPADIAVDISGNLNYGSLSTDNSVTIDRTPPTIIWQMTDAFTDGLTSRVRVADTRLRILFSEPVSWSLLSTIPARTHVGIAGSAVSVGHTGLSYSSPPLPSATVLGVYEVIVDVRGLSLTGELNASLTVLAKAVTDRSSNTNHVASSFTILIDLTAPTATISRHMATRTPTNQATLSFDVEWSELVTGLTPSDITVVGTTAATTIIVQSIGNLSFVRAHLVSVSGMTHDGPVSLLILTNAVTDIAGNANAVVSTSPIIDYDTRPPRFSLDSPRSGSASMSPILIAFNMSDTAAAGSLRLTFRRIVAESNKISDVLSPHVFILNDLFNSIGLHSFDLNALGPLLTDDGAIVSATFDGVETSDGHPLVSDVMYSVELTCYDLAGNMETVVVTPFTFDITPPPVPRLFKPEASGTRGVPLQVQFQSVVPTSYVSLTFVDQTGTDPWSPHIVVFNNSVFGTLRYTTYLPSQLAGGDFVSSVSTAPLYDILMDQASYTVTLLIKDVAGNEASTSNEGFTFDSVTAQSPDVLLPDSYSLNRAPLTLTINLPQAAEAGSVVIVFTQTGGEADSGSPHVLLATFTSVGIHTVVILAPHTDLTPPGSLLSLSSGSRTLISGAIYSIRVQYRDVISSNPGYSLTPSVVFDFVPPAVPLLVSPAFASGWTTFIPINYTLPEAAASGSVRLTLTDSSGSTMVIITLAPSMEVQGCSTMVLPCDTLTNNAVQSVTILRPLVDDQPMSIKLSYTDSAGNPSPSAIRSGIVLDRKIPSIVDFTSPVANTAYGSTMLIKWKHTSKAADGTVAITFEATSSRSQVAALTWTLIMDDSFESIGVKSIVLNTANMASTEGVLEVRSSFGWSSLSAASSEVASLSSDDWYTVTISYQNLPGLFASASVASVVVDLNSPVSPLLSCNRVSNINLQCTLRLNETALSGSVQLTLRPNSTSAGTVRTITFDSTTETTSIVMVTLPCSGLLAGTAVASVVPVASLVSDATYLVSLSYRDSAGNLASSASLQFTYDKTRPPAAIFVSPQVGTIFEPPFGIQFVLAEEALAGSLVIRFRTSTTSTTSDTYSPHELVLAPFMGTAGAHTFTVSPSSLSSSLGTLSSTPSTPEVANQLVDGVIYDVIIIYKDLAGNSIDSTVQSLSYSSQLSCPPLLDVPPNGGVGTCSSLLLHGRSCSISCKSGYSVHPPNSRRTCNNGHHNGVSQFCQGITIAANLPLPVFPLLSIEPTPFVPYRAIVFNCLIVGARFNWQLQQCWSRICMFNWLRYGLARERSST